MKRRGRRFYSRVSAARDPILIRVEEERRSRNPDVRGLDRWSRQEGERIEIKALPDHVHPDPGCSSTRFASIRSIRLAGERAKEQGRAAEEGRGKKGRKEGD